MPLWAREALRAVLTEQRRRIDETLAALDSLPIAHKGVSTRFSSHTGREARARRKTHGQGSDARLAAVLSESGEGLEPIPAKPKAKKLRGSYRRTPH
jgi:hypothetical protein